MKDCGLICFIFLISPILGCFVELDIRVSFLNVIIAGLEVRKYRYYDNDSCSLDFSNLINDMRAMPEGSCILLHACAHNPTGMDPTVDQWKEIRLVFLCGSTFFLLETILTATKRRRDGEESTSLL